MKLVESCSNRQIMVLNVYRQKGSQRRQADFGFDLWDRVELRVG